MGNKIRMTAKQLHRVISEAVAGDPGKGVPGLLGKLLSMRWNQDRGSMWDTIKVVDLKGISPERGESIAEDVVVYNTAVRKMNAALRDGKDWGEWADLAERKLGDLIRRWSTRAEMVGGDMATLVYDPYTRNIDIIADGLPDGVMTLEPGEAGYDRELAKFN